MQLAEARCEIHLAIRGHGSGGNEAQGIAERIDDAPAGAAKARIDADDANRVLHGSNPNLSMPGRCQQNVNKTKTSDNAFRGLEITHEIVRLRLGFTKFALLHRLVSAPFTRRLFPWSPFPSSTFPRSRKGQTAIPSPAELPPPGAGGGSGRLQALLAGRASRHEGHRQRRDLDRHLAMSAAGTKTIRVGSGGIMLPNHSPLVIAEQFGTLAALYPGRIDLGLGRAPGTDMRTAAALRRNMEASANNFPNDVVELQALLGPADEDQDPDCRSRRRQQRADLAARFQPSTAPISPACSACPSPSPRISRRTCFCRRWKSIASVSSRRNISTSPMPWSASWASPPIPTTRRNHHFTSMQQSFVALRRNARGQFPPPVARTWTISGARRKSLRRSRDDLCGRRRTRDRKAKLSQFIEPDGGRRSDRFDADLRHGCAAEIGASYSHNCRRSRRRPNDRKARHSPFGKPWENGVDFGGRIRPKAWP